MTGKQVVMETINCNKPQELPVLMWVDGIRYEIKSKKLRIAVEKILKKNAFKHIIQLCQDKEEVVSVTLEWPDSNIGWRDWLYAHKFGAVWSMGGTVFKDGMPIWSPLENNFTINRINKLEFPDPGDHLYLNKAKRKIEKNQC